MNEKCNEFDNIVYIVQLIKSKHIYKSNAVRNNNDASDCYAEN